MKHLPKKINSQTYPVGRRAIVKKTFDVNGEEIVFETFGLEGKEHAAVIALTQDNKVVIAQQFRYGPEKIMYELPGGNVDPGEAPIDAAKRELFEETGYRPGDIEYLGRHYKDAYMNATWHYYFATNCTKTEEQNLDEGEIVEVQLIDIKTLISNARSDKMTDSVAVLMAYEELIDLVD